MDDWLTAVLHRPKARQRSTERPTLLASKDEGNWMGRSLSVKFDDAQLLGRVAAVGTDPRSGEHSAVLEFVRSEAQSEFWTAPIAVLTDRLRMREIEEHEPPKKTPRVRSSTAKRSKTTAPSGAPAATRRWTRVDDERLRQAMDTYEADRPAYWERVAAYVGKPREVCVERAYNAKALADKKPGSSRVLKSTSELKKKTKTNVRAYLRGALKRTDTEASVTSESHFPIVRGTEGLDDSDDDDDKENDAHDPWLYAEFDEAAVNRTTRLKRAATGTSRAHEARHQVDLGVLIDPVTAKHSLRSALAIQSRTIRKDVEEFDENYDLYGERSPVVDLASP